MAAAMALVVSATSLDSSSSALATLEYSALILSASRSSSLIASSADTSVFTSSVNAKPPETKYFSGSSPAWDVARFARARAVGEPLSRMRSTGGGRARPKSPAPRRKTPRTRGVDDGDDARLELLREGRVARRDAVLAGDAGQRHGVDALLEIKDRVGRAEAQLEARRGVAQGARRPPREGGADAGAEDS